MNRLISFFPALAIWIAGAVGLTAQPLNTDFRQSANKDAPYLLGDVHWIGSILQSSNSYYKEGMSVLQRAFFINIPATAGDVHTLTFNHQALKSGHHAYDYLTSWPQGVAAALDIAGAGILVNVNECGEEIHPPANLGAICGAIHSGGNFLDIPAPDNMGILIGHDIAASAAAYEAHFGNRTIRIWGNAPISSGTLLFTGYSGGADKDAEYTLSWVSASTQIIIEMAGHLAQGDDVPAVGPGIGYGTGFGAGSISGGPFHFKMHLLDGGSIGSQDNQIMGGSVLQNLLCAIAGPSEVCAASSGNVFNGSTTLQSPAYSWSVTGGTIDGPSNLPTVSVTAGNGSSMTVFLAITGSNGSSSCSMDVTIDQQTFWANAGADQTVCASDPTVTLNGSIGGGASSATWSGGTGTFTYDIPSQTWQYHPSAAEIAGAGTPAGVVTLTLTTNDPDGPCGPVSDDMTVTINPAATADAGPDQEVCATSPVVTLAGSVGGGAASGTWSGGAGTFSPDASTLNATYTPTSAEIAAGSVTLTLTTNDPDGPCPAVSDQMTITYDPAPVVNAGPDQTVGECNTVQLAGSFNNVVSSVTWSTSGDGYFTPNVNDPNAVYHLGSLDIAAQSVTLTLTSNDPPGPCGPVSDAMIVTIILKPVCTLTAPSPLPACGSTQNTLSGPSAPSGMTYTWHWTLTSTDAGWMIIGSPDQQTIHYAAGGMGSTATFTLTITDQFGCSGGCSLTITLPVEHCTLTQGFYGNSGGTSCKTGLGTLATIQSLLSTDLVIGRAGNNRSLTIKYADAACIIQRLPANATPAILPAGNGFFTSSCGTTTGIPMKNGKFQSVLLGQTITLGLNLRLDAALGSQLLPPPATPWLNAQNPTLVNSRCGDCGDGGDIANGGLVSYPIPVSVLNTLGSNGTNRTVADLYALANDALGGLSIAGTTLADINAAVSAFNNGFDACRFFFSFTASPLVKTTPPEVEWPADPAAPDRYELFDNYPNPFNPSTTIGFALPAESRVTLSIYSLTGRRIAVLADGVLPAGQQSVVWNATDDAGREVPSGAYTYTLRAVSTADGKEFFMAKQLVLMK